MGNPTYSISVSTASEAGSCHACDDHVGIAGVIDHRVYVIRAGGEVIRLCDEAMRGFNVEVAAAVREVNMVDAGQDPGLLHVEGLRTKVVPVLPSVPELPGARPSAA